MQSLESIKAKAVVAIETASDIAAVEELRVRYLGKKGALTNLLKNLGQLSAEERPKAGAEINTVKQQLNERLNARRELLQGAAIVDQLAKEATISLARTTRGDWFAASDYSYHPAHGNILLHGLEVVEGQRSRMSTTTLKRSISPYHPARAMHDTFYVEDTHVLARIPAQVRQWRLSSHPSG